MSVNNTDLISIGSMITRRSVSSNSKRQLIVRFSYAVLAASQRKQVCKSKLECFNLYRIPHQNSIFANFAAFTHQKSSQIIDKSSLGKVLQMERHQPYLYFGRIRKPVPIGLGMAHELP